MSYDTPRADACHDRTPPTDAVDPVCRQAQETVNRLKTLLNRADELLRRTWALLRSLGGRNDSRSPPKDNAGPPTVLPAS